MRFKDLTEEKFGQLTVIKRLEPQRGRTTKWICKCECGEETIVQRSNLQSGAIKSCGQHLYQNLKGQKFGRLTPLEKGAGHKHRNGVNITWICQCDCGNKSDVMARQLITGKTRSCGCLRKEKTRERSFTGYKNISGKYWSSVVKGAKNRGLEFNITKEYIWEMYEQQNRKCNLSGMEILFDLDHTKKTASIDRIDNTKGYIKGNIQILHVIVNKMKNNLTEEEFIQICKKIAKNN